MKKIQIKKNKKAEDGTSLLFKLIVVLIVLLLVFTLLMKYTPLGDLLLSFLEALGLYKLQAYTSPDAGNTQALNSIYGLMYAVNRISWYETNFGSKNWDWNEDIDIKEELKKDLGSDIGSFSDIIREYGDTGVYPTIIDSALYMYNSNDVDEVSVDIARKILQCWDMYNDLQKKNTRCFSLDFGTYSGEGIERLNIEEGLIYLRDTDKENECDKSCKEKSEEILGGFFQDWTIRDRTQWKFDIDGAITSENSLFGSKDKRLIQICAETGNSIFTLDRIYITDQIDVCKTPLDEFKFGFMVQDFKLPEDVATGLSAGGQTSFYKRFIGAYGDPKYMVYYEKFPEGEDDAWAGYPFDDLGTTTIGIVSGLLLRRLPFGSKIAEVIRKPQVTMAIANLVTRTIDIVRSSPDFFSASFLLIQEIEESITEIAEKVVQFFDPSSIEPEPTELKEYLAVKYVGMPLIGEILESKKSSAESIPDYNAVKKQLVSNYMDLVESNKESLSYDFVDESGKPTVRFMTLLKEGMFEEGLSEEQKISLSAVKEEILEEISILFIDYYQDYRFLTNIAYRVNTEIEDNFYLLEEGTSAAIDSLNVRIYFRLQSNKKKQSGLVGEDKQSIPVQIGIIKEMALEMQILDNDFMSDMKSSTITDLNAKFEDIKNVFDQDLKNEIKYEEYDGELRDVPSTRNTLTEEYSAFEFFEGSISEKYKFTGTNSIGFRTPYRATVVYNDALTKSWDWPKDKEKYLEYFNFFGGFEGSCKVEECEIDDDCGDCPNFECNREKKKCYPKDNSVLTSKKYVGLLPEVNRYYLTMVRDKSKAGIWAYTLGGLFETIPVVNTVDWFSYWSDTLYAQPNTRFHLVSPCKANLIVKVSRCECYGRPSDGSLSGELAVMFGSARLYETGKYNPVYGTVIENFDGTNPMLYSIDPDSGQIIKECQPKDLGNYLPWNTNPTYKPMCIEINPILDDSYNNNYCYRGYKPIELKAFDFMLDWGIPLTCATAGSSVDILTGGTDGFIGSMAAFGTCSMVTGIIDLTIGEMFETACYKWPKRGGNTGKPCCLLQGTIPMLYNVATGNCEEFS